MKRALPFALLLVLLPALVFAEAYPTKVVTIIVPFAQGGPTDTVARLIAQSMTGGLGKKVTVENIGGAGGTSGTTRAAKSAADGYTLLLHHIGMATSATLYRKLGYDAINDFEPIGLVTDVPMTLVAKKALPAKDLRELIDYVKKN